MAEGDSMFEALYNRLILRDLFGKMVPGAIALATLLHPYVTDLPIQAASLDSWLGFLVVGLIAGASWLTGFAVQAFGEHSGLLRYFPKALDKVRWRKVKFADLDGNEIAVADASTTVEQRYQEFIDDYGRAAKQPAQVQQVERFVVIKEACGNGYLALSLGISLLTVRWLVDGGLALYSGELPPINAEDAAVFVKKLVTFAVVIAITVYLRKMHLIHVTREFIHRRQVMRPQAPQEGAEQIAGNN